MSDTTQQPVPEERAPKSLSEVFADLQGFGIEESDDILTVSSDDRMLRFKFSNISTEEDLQANLATEEAKGYEHFQRIKAEILSRAITWVNGVDLTKLEGAARLVTDPKTGEKVDLQVSLRRTILGWGGEVMQVLWKLLMVHMQKIEDRLLDSLPDAATMTAVEQRYREQALAQIEAVTRDVIQASVADLFDDEAPTDTEEAPTS